MTRYNVSELHGLAMRNTGTVKWDWRGEYLDLSERTLNLHIKALKNRPDIYGTATDVVRDDVRIVTARYYVSGVENVRELRITAK